MVDSFIIYIVIILKNFLNLKAIIYIMAKKKEEKKEEHKQ